MDLECNETLLEVGKDTVVTLPSTAGPKRIMSCESPRPENPPDNRPSTPVKKTTAKGKNKIKKRKTIKKTIRKKRKTIRKRRRKGKKLKKRKTM